MNERLELHKEQIIETQGGNYAVHFWGKETKHHINPEDNVNHDYDVIKEKKMIRFSSHEEIIEYYNDTYSVSQKLLHQVHGNEFIHLTSKPSQSQKENSTWAEADAFISQDRKFSGFIKTADCVPILFFHPNMTLFGGIHSGWRGMQQKIVSSVVHSLEKDFPDQPIAHEIQFIVGPCILQSHYQVGTEVYTQFPQQCSHFDGVGGKKNLDMLKVLKTEFQELGISESQCTWMNENTYASNQYFSHRCGESGRNLTTIISI